MKLPPWKICKADVWSVSPSSFALKRGQRSKCQHCDVIREFRKLRRQLQRKRNIKIELCVKLSVLRLFHVKHVAQNRRSVLSLAWHEWFSCKDKEWRLALSSEPQIWKFLVVVCQATSKYYTKRRAARAARLIFLIQPIKSLIWGVAWLLLRRQILYSIQLADSAFTLLSIPFTWRGAMRLQTTKKSNSPIDGKRLQAWWIAEVDTGNEAVYGCY